jgi:hypothetical protein
MTTFIATIILCLLPFSTYALTDKEVFELLSKESKQVTNDPFHVYISRDYDDFEGSPLPISAYSFFASEYTDLKDAKEPGEIFATYQFTQGSRWKCFLLRVPGMYAIDDIDIWII